MFLAFGDSHRNKRALAQMAAIIHKLQPEFFVHTGDNFSDYQWIKKRTGTFGHGVRGNCDGGIIIGSREEIIFTHENKKFLLIHGHQYRVKYSYENLYYHARDAEVDAVIFGHSHVQFAQQEDGLWLINPGSISLPRGGSWPGYAKITSGTEIQVELIKL